MSDNKKFRIQNGVDVTGELSINDVVVIDANGKVVPEAISEAISGSTSSDIAALQAQVSAILGTSPETLDTLQEIVASFQDADSNIVTTVSTNTTAIADMQPQVSTNTDAIAATNARTSGISTSSGSSNIQMSAEVDMDGNKVTNMGEPTDGSDAATKDYVDVKSQLAVTTGATDKTELLAAIAAETNRATVVESTLQTNIDSLSDDKDSDIAQEITNRTTADALLQAQIDAEESARTIQDASLDSKITSEATRAVAAELGLQQSINDITSGTSEFTGDLIPDQDNVHSLGSETKMWKDVYVGPGSLYINGQKVIEDNSGTITVNADPGQNLSLNTSGGGAIDLNSGAESVQIRSDLVISSSKTISTTGGAPTKFGGDVDMQGNTLGNVAEPVNDNDAVTKAWFESYVATPHTGSKTFVDDVVIQGNLTVSGSTITVNSETMSVADNMVDLNSNMTSGTPTENAGIRVMRGDQSPKTFLWNEANDQWTAEGPLKADSFVGDGSGLSGMYGDADVTALVDSAYVQSRQSTSVAHATQADNADTLDGQHGSYYQPAATAITTGNIGAQSVSYATTSGDANTLDGINSTSFARSDLGNIWEPTSINTFKSTGDSNLHNQSSLQVYNDTTGEDAFMTFHVANDFAVNFGLDASTNDLFVGGWSMTGPYKIWHEGNAPGVVDLTSKLSSISTGIDVTGSLVSDGLTVDGSAVVRSGNTLTLNRTDNAIGGAMSYVAGTGFIFNDANGDGTSFNVGATTRLRIDSSGNLLVGHTSLNGTGGVDIGASGYVRASRSGDEAAIFNRETNDGAIVSLQKDGLQVGSIGVVAANNLYIHGDTIGLGIGDDNLYPTNSAGAASDATVNIGDPTARFKDLYLSRIAKVGSGSFDEGGVQHSYGSNANSRSWWLKTDTHGYGDFALRQSTTKTGSTYETKLLIDASGSLLVGTTINDGQSIGAGSQDGIVLAGESQYIQRGDNANLWLSKPSGATNSEFIKFYDNSSAVGSIGNAGGTLQIHGTSGGLFLTSSIEPTNGSSRTDNATDLGSSTYRFKDLYLSGNAYIGGNTAIHSGNIGSQTVSHAATATSAAAATSANQIDNVDFFNSNTADVSSDPQGNGIGYYISGANFTGNAGDGAVYSQHYSSHWGHRIFGDYRSGMIAVQGRNGGALQAIKAVPTITVDTAPSSGWNSPGEMWWDTTSGRLKIAVGTGAADIQWVDASPSGNVETKFDKAGGTLTGPVTMMSQLDVRGTILAVDINASGTVTQASDASLKDDVQVIENAVEKVSQIRGVTFTRNDVEDDSRHAGVIAQEVESVLPEVVSETNGKKSVAYGNMVGLLIEAVKEQQATIDALAKRVEELEGE